MTGVDTSSQDHTAFDPSYTDPPTAHVAGDDSDGLESDEEVKAVVGQLDESVSQLSSYNPTIEIPLDFTPDQKSLICLELLNRKLVNSLGSCGHIVGGSVYEGSNAV